jgi:hypothetical protein
MAAPPRRDDHESARELQERLQRAGGSEWVDLAALRTWFGGDALSAARKRQIGAALAGAHIDAYPPIEQLSGRERVRLEALREPEPRHGLRPRVKRYWRSLRAWLFTPLGKIIGFASFVVTAAGLVAAVTGGGGQAPARMAGDLNVAVAPFTTGGKATPEGVALARDAAQNLRSELPRLDRTLQIEVRGPEELPALAGGDAGSQANGARVLAHTVGADIVVYGELASSPQQTRLRPAFYLNAEKLPSAGALDGGYGYGGAISLPYALAVSPPARAQIRAALIHRTEGYAETFIGVGYYLLHSFDAAERHLRQALGAAPSSSVPALLRLLLGNVADQRKETKVAAHDYSLASHNDSTGVRARLGLADVEYEVGHGHCRADAIDTMRLRAARRGFSSVLDSLGGLASARSGSRLAAKAAFGAGQVDLCLSAAHVAQRWDRAHEEFAATIASYTEALPELRDDTAEAHAGIGLCDLSTEKAPRAYEDARREYLAAAQTTTIPSRRAYFEGAVGFADSQLGLYSAALTMYRDGARIAGATPLGRTLSQKAARLASTIKVEP